MKSSVLLISSHIFSFMAIYGPRPTVATLDFVHSSSWACLFSSKKRNKKVRFMNTYSIHFSDTCTNKLWVESPNRRKSRQSRKTEHINDDACNTVSKFIVKPHSSSSRSRASPKQKQAQAGKRGERKAYKTAALRLLLLSAFPFSRL